MIRIENEWRYLDETLNMPYPWYVKPVIEMLDKMDLNGKLIFEYGVGDSTYWYRDKGANVCGVDSDVNYALATVSIYRNTYPDYVNAIDIYQGILFDIIVIDGNYRDSCLRKAIQHLKQDGFIIIDNFEQPSADLSEWPQTRALIEAQGLKLEIYKEEGHPDWKTAIVRL